MIKTLAMVSAVAAILGAGYAELGNPPEHWVETLDSVWRSALATLLACLLSWAIIGACDSLNRGKAGWQLRLRSRMGVEADAKITEVSWAKYLLLFALWTALPFAVLRIWGLVDQAESWLTRLWNSGFAVGEFTVVPGKLFMGLVMFGALITFTRWFKWKLETNWLRSVAMEHSTRESVATIFGYATFVIALFAALSVAGFDLGNLALVAGALSLGIGFGLQNIVNNFVSGLILLFERPIRTGDYIYCNTNEGFVRKIRIRSTEIETLDRMSIIIPNSDLIANAVENWMLRDRYGRITVSVGVAYGSDTELVRRTLINVADEHPHVLSADQANVPGPVVQFSAFGDSSLDFELKIFIHEIEKRFIVASELRFAIDKAFRENGITIPFPQRDLWVKQVPGQANDSGIRTSTDTVSPRASNDERDKSA